MIFYILVLPIVITGLLLSFMLATVWAAFKIAVRIALHPSIILVGFILFCFLLALGL